MGVGGMIRRCGGHWALGAGHYWPISLGPLVLKGSSRNNEKWPGRPFAPPLLYFVFFGGERVPLQDAHRRPQHCTTTCCSRGESEGVAWRTGGVYPEPRTADGNPDYILTAHHGLCRCSSPRGATTRRSKFGSSEGLSVLGLRSKHWAGLGWVGLEPLPSGEQGA